MKIESRADYGNLGTVGFKVEANGVKNELGCRHDKACDAYRVTLGHVRRESGSHASQVFDLGLPEMRAFPRIPAEFPITVDFPWIKCVCRCLLVSVPWDIA